MTNLTAFTEFIHRIAACGSDGTDDEENKLTENIYNSIIKASQIYGDQVIIKIPFSAMWIDDIEAAKHIDGFVFTGIHINDEEDREQKPLEIWFEKNE